MLVRHVRSRRVGLRSNSWVKIGFAGLRQPLQAGVNDAGGTLMNENISRAAGASHGQMLDEDGLRELVEGLGRRLVRRTTLYGLVADLMEPAAA